MSHLQIQFQHFPGREPWSTMGDWRFLPGPAEDVPYQGRAADADDDDIVSDAVMRMVDYAIQYAPGAFGVDLTNGEYEKVNDLSIELMDRVLSAIERAGCYGEGNAPPKDAVTAKWYVDVPLAEGVTIRVAEFR